MSQRIRIKLKSFDHTLVDQSAAKIAKTALKNNTTLKHEALKSGLINEKEYNKIVDPKKMIKPN